MKSWLLGIFAVFGLLASSPVLAQGSDPVTVSACGTPPNTPVVGISYPPTQDTTRKLCTSGSGGGGGGGAVTAVSDAFALGAIVDIGTGVSPGANTLNGRLATLNTTASGLALESGGNLANLYTTIGNGASPAANTTNAFLKMIAANTGSAVTGYAQGSATAGQVGPLQQITALSAAPSYSNGTTNPQSSDLNGGMRTLLQDGNGTSVSYTTTTPVGLIGAYPANNVLGTVTAATPITCTSGIVSAATATCTLAGVSGKTTYLTGWTCTGGGATVGALVTITITGEITGTQSYPYAAVAGALLMGSILQETRIPGTPASAQNTAIVIAMPSLGTGNTAASCNAQGFQL